MPKCAYCFGTGEIEEEEIRFDPVTQEPVRGPVNKICPHCHGDGYVTHKEHREQVQEFRVDDYMEEKFENEDFAKDGDNHN